MILHKNMFSNSNTAQFINTVIKLADDKTASLAPFLYPQLQEIEVNPNSRARTMAPIVASGTRINWRGEILRAIVDIEDIIENNPDNAPLLWEHIGYKNGYRMIDSETAFMNGEYGWFCNSAYRSKIDNNLTNPESNPENWEEIGGI